MANVGEFMSDECSSTISNKWVFSVAPTVVPSDITSPYKMLDHVKSNMQLRLMPYDSNGGKNRVVFNLTWPQYDTLVKVVDAAIMGQVSSWDISVATGDTFSRIFGNPGPDGLCPARVLTIRREPTMADGTKAKLPWKIEIKNGRAKKVQSSNGSSYMQGGTFVEEQKVTARLSDGQMKENLYWGSQMFDVFFEATKQGLLDGHAEMERRKSAAAAAKRATSMYKN